MSSRRLPGCASGTNRPELSRRAGGAERLSPEDVQGPLALGRVTEGRSGDAHALEDGDLEVVRPAPLGVIAVKFLARTRQPDIAAGLEVALRRAGHDVGNVAGVVITTSHFVEPYDD